MDAEHDPQSAPWASAVLGLIARVATGLEGRVRVASLASPGRRFRYRVSDGILTVAATDAVSACVGVHSFLREQCDVAVHWDTVLPVDVPLPSDTAVVEREARVAQQYMFNFCTFSYTMANWTWEQWEREIDWMALHGVTMPLAATGHEAALLDAYRQLGLGEQDALDFIGAEAYAAFTFMGNLDSAIGPATREQVESRARLGRRILDRERSLGMTPVLPAFTGNVPRALFPDRVTARDWQGFTTHVLHPGDPAFVDVATAIASAQKARFGTDHLYAADPFIEMIPVDDDQDFPGLVARSLLTALTAVDPAAVWVLQSWPFSYQADFWTGSRVTAFLEAVPAERLLVLDLWAEEDPQWDRYEGFFGRPWMWCALVNFGGRSDPVGDVQRAVDEFERSLAAAHRPIGLGLTMEATRNNPFLFELIAELAWLPVPDVGGWTARFAVERYGRDIPVAGEAWQALLETVYGSSGRRVFPEDFLGLLTRRPTTVLAPGPTEVDAAVRSLVWFDPLRLQQAVEQLARAAETHPEAASGALGHDLADATIAWAVRLFDAVGAELFAARESGAPRDDADAERLLGIIDALDAVLATRAEMRTSTWMGALPRSAVAEADAIGVRAARQILTTWNNEPRRQLDDYSARIWHGLLAYYRRRWEAWLSCSPAEVEERLDEAWLRFMSDGPVESPEDGQPTAAAVRRMLDRFGSTYADAVRAPEEEA